MGQVAIVNGRALGKHAPRYDARSLLYHNYRTASLPPTPPTSDWTPAFNATKKPWGVALNDQLGICTVAAIKHIIMCNTANSGNLIIPSDAQCLAMYELPNIGNFDPKDPQNTDNGANELDVLKQMRSVGLDGQKVRAFVDIQVANFDHLREAIHLFGSAYIGVQLTQRDMDNVDAGKPWTYLASDTQFVGGHAIPLFAYDASTFVCVTWGAIQIIDPRWLAQRMDEAHAALFNDWFDKNNQAPSGYDADALLADLPLAA